VNLARHGPGYFFNRAAKDFVQLRSPRHKEATTDYVFAYTSAPETSPATCFGICAPHSFGAENSVTILRLVRSSLQSLHRYDNFQSSQIREGVAGSALAWLRALHLCLCSRRRCGKRSFTASRTSWRRWWRTLWTRTRRNVRSVESLRFAVPGAGTVAIAELRPASITLSRERVD
jgi:hypothetical protein